MIESTMAVEIAHIYLSSVIEGDQLDAHTDVLVEFEDGDKYIASFFTYKNLQTLQIKNQKTDSYLKGKYFWVRGMITVEDCSRETIENVIHDLVEEGDFKEIFRKIN